MIINLDSEPWSSRLYGLASTADYRIAPQDPQWLRVIEEGRKAVQRFEPVPSRIGILP